MNSQLKFLIECNQDSDFGYRKWNDWKSQNPDLIIDLSNSKLNNRVFYNYNFDNVNFEQADFTGSQFIHCEFNSAMLDNAIFQNLKCYRTSFYKASLNNTDFSNSELISIDLLDATCKNSNFKNSEIVYGLLNGGDFSNSDFSSSKLIGSNVIDCNLQGAKFINCFLNGSNLSKSNLDDSIIKNTTIYGVSAWDISSKNSVQENLIITNHNDDKILTVDDLGVANFIYLIINNENVSNIIDVVSNKVVLILGRFTNERLETLNYIKEILKSKNYVPILFDFEKPHNKDLTETIGLMGRMSKFVIADLTDAKSIPQELSELVPNNPSITIYPIILENETEYSMFEHWTKFPWVKEIYRYKENSDLDDYFE